MEIARLSSGKGVRNVIALWDDLPEFRRSPRDVEVILTKVGLDLGDFLAEVMNAGHRASVNHAALLQGLALPLVVEATVQQALKTGGHRERRLIYQSTGMLPQPRNSFTAISGQNVQVNQVQPQAPGLPRFEDENAIDVPVQR